MNRLEELRKEKGWTRVHLAELVEYTEQSIFRWEKGTRQMSADAVIKLSKALGCSADYLLGLDPSKAPAGESQERSN